LARGSGHNRLALAIGLLALQPLSPLIAYSVVFAMTALTSGGANPAGTLAAIGPSTRTLAAIIVIPFVFAIVGMLVMIDLRKSTLAFIVPAVAIVITCTLFLLLRT
jgi:hypothetical protein